MRRVIVILTLCVSALVAIAPLDTAQRQRDGRGGQGERQRQERSRDDLELRRRRWSEKSQSEREVLMKRYRELQRLSPAERQKLMERAQRFEKIQKSLRETAPEDLKQEIDSLDPKRREHRWREHTVRRSREMGRHLREGMPAEFRQRLENASPEERERMLEHFGRDQGERSCRAIRGMGRMLGLSREEVQRMEELPLEERLATMMRLKRQMLTQRIESNGLPKGLDEQTWQDMQQLSDEEFLQRMHTIMPVDRQRWRSMRGRKGDGDEGFSRNRRRGDRFQERNR